MSIQHIDAVASAPPKACDRRFWTTREIDVVRQHYSAGGIVVCSSMLPDRSESSIYQRAHQLHLRSPRGEYSMERWTTNDGIDAVIRRAYTDTPTRKGIAKCAATVGRPRHWVSKRAMVLGLVAPRLKQPDWTSEELELIGNNAHKHPSTLQRMLAKRGFKRTETSIVIKLKRTGADREDPHHYTASGFSRLMGVDIKVVTGWIARGLLKAGRRGTERTSAQGGDQWWIKRTDARRFIIENAAAIDIRKVDKFWFIDFVARAA